MKFIFQLTQINYPKKALELMKSIGGNESIMVVDDEKSISEMVLQMLTRLGYQIETFNNSQDALNAFQQNPGKYDLLISDLTMPNMTGLQLSQAIQLIDDQFPIIIMTGYGNSNLTELSKKEAGIRHVLKKPLVRKDLAKLIRDVFASKN